MITPIALNSLKSNRARSLLTQLGILIGVAAVLMTVTLGQFSQRKIIESYETLGVNKVLLTGYPSRNYNSSATSKNADTVDTQSLFRFQSFDPDRDYAAIRRNFPEVSLISPVIMGHGVSATAGGLSTQKDLFALGVSPDYLAITSRTLQEGRNMNSSHIEDHNAVCLVGSDIVQSLFKHRPALGETIYLSGNSKSYSCKVIGVLKEVSTNKEGVAPNRQVLLPYTYFQAAAADGWSVRIGSTVMQLNFSSNVEAVSLRIKNYLNEKYNGTGRFSMDRDSTLVSQMKRSLNIFTILLTSVACISLLVGGIGVNNMMLASVTERLREFGLRKALGATRMSIRFQVLQESLILCVGAGVAGLILGGVLYELLILAASKFIAQVHFEWILDPFAIVLSFSSILFVGIASGFTPARRAEKCETIEALRAE